MPRYSKGIEIENLIKLISTLGYLIDLKFDIKEVINVEEFKKKVKETIDYILG